VTAFFDTNVLVYAFATHEPKRDIAQEVLASGGVISVQVVNEFANVLRKKQRQEWPRIEAALAVVERWFETIRPVTLETHRTALPFARFAGIGIYDALIVARSKRAAIAFTARTCSTAAGSAIASSSIRSWKAARKRRTLTNTRFESPRDRS
jgi:predicted nucleic acid-binding protein